MVISCPVPFGNDLTVFEESMKHVIANCPYLSSLVFDPSFQRMSAMRLGRSFPIGDGPLNIRRLEWGYNLLLGDLVSLLQYCLGLESLQFHLHDEDQPDFEKAIGTSVVLPHLQELQLVRHNPGHATIAVAESRLAAQWSMPQLQKFTYNSRDPCNNPVDIVGFCRIHGCSLRYLHLGPDWREWGHPTIATLQDILNKCPALEHLVLWTSGNLRTVSSLIHRKIVWIDLWVCMHNNKELVKKFLRTKPCGLSSLDRVRVFDKGLWRPHATDLPSLLPPATAVLEDGFGYNYLDLGIKQKGNLVFRVDLPWDSFDGEVNASGDAGNSDSDDHTSDGDSNDDDDDDDDDDALWYEEECMDCEEDEAEMGYSGRFPMDPEFELASFLSILES
jgi:hypothetical protein